jgi:hypothetical protein
MTKSLWQAFLLLLITAAWAGCVPLGGAAGTQTSRGNQAPVSNNSAVQLPIYSVGDLDQANYIKVARLGAWSCSALPFGPPPAASAVIAELKTKALQMGADGLTDVTCGHQGPAGTRCSSPTSCIATAIRFVHGNTPP